MYTSSKAQDKLLTAFYLISKLKRAIGRAWKKIYTGALSSVNCVGSPTEKKIITATYTVN